MSENLFRIQSMGQNLVTGWYWTLLVFIIASIVYFLVSEHLDNKKRKAEEDLREIGKDSRNKIHELNMEAIGAEQERKEEIQKEIEKIEEDEKVASKDLNETVAKYERKIKRADNLKFFQYGVGIVWIVFLLIAVILAPLTGGSFSSLRKVDYEEMDLKVTAYYVVSYKEVDQVTLTVFVKNNSDKSLRSAQIKQKGTNNTEVVRNLDSGEEKIVTIDTYSSGNYEFVFENIEFIE